MGARFKEIGITKPKHEIIVKGKSLFEISMLSLSDFFSETFLFIVRRDCYNADTILTLCKKIGIFNYEIIEITDLTDGQARTALLADKYIDGEDSIIIYNIDTAVEPFKLKKGELSNYDGFIPCFNAEGEQWSFVKPSDSERGVVAQVVEKKRISNLATIGFYYFKRFLDFKETVEKYQIDIKANYIELYIAPVYQYLIDQNKKVGFSVIDSHFITNLGTPSEIEKHDKYYMQNNS